ncbi:MAG TPA: hypothetical protein VN881_06225 [Candidatus Acidoferrales bacterium]|nr:hypothetical protein [Candidatus Acidoferrales bacterium]
MGAYKENFPKGSRVRIADRTFLENFLATWKYHHKLQPEQLAYSDREAVVKGVAFYHGGDPLYTLSDIPGMWHEECLRSLPGQTYATEVLAPEPAAAEVNGSMKFQRRRKFIFAAVLAFVLLIFLALVITLLPGIEALLQSAH